MDCEYVKKVMADFLSGSLDEASNDQIGEHLIQCPACQEEMDAYKASWDMLGEWQEQEPDRSYLSDFWIRVSAQRSWGERIREIIRPVGGKRIVPVIVSVCVLIVVGFFTIRTTWQISRTEMLLTALSAEEIEFVQNLELAEYLDLLQEMELLEQLEPLNGAGAAGQIKRIIHVS